MRAQPRGRRGTPERPYTALDLRLVLAGFGLVASAAFALLLFWVGNDLLGWALVLVAGTAAADLVVVQRRRSARRRSRPSSD